MAGLRNSFFFETAFDPGAFLDGGLLKIKLNVQKENN